MSIGWLEGDVSGVFFGLGGGFGGILFPGESENLVGNFLFTVVVEFLSTSP